MDTGAKVTFHRLNVTTILQNYYGPCSFDKYNGRFELWSFRLVEKQIVWDVVESDL